MQTSWARCRYVNKYCSFQTTGWGCCLCGTYNEYRELSNRRCAGRRAVRGLPRAGQPPARSRLMPQLLLREQGSLLPTEVRAGGTKG